MRLLLLTPEYEGAGGGIMTYYRALAPALCAAGVEMRVVEGSALCTAEDRAERSFGGVRIETLERARLRALAGALPRLCGHAGPSSPFGSRLGDVGAGGLRRGIRYCRSL